MQETFKEIEREISARKIEIKVKHNSPVSLFGNEQESLFSVNSYIHAGDYWKHLYRIINRAKEAIKAQHDLCTDHLSALDLLEDHQLYLCELRKMYLPDNKKFILDGAELVRSIPNRHGNDYTEILKKKILHFSQIQKTAIHGLEDFLERKIKSTELRIRLYPGNDSSLRTKPVKFKQTEQLGLFEQNTPHSPKLFWTRTDADLVELITALFEVNALKSDEGILTKKQLHKALESLFNHPVKEVRAKLYKIKSRKGKQDLFLHALKIAFLNGISRIDNPGSE
jgi:hypothetical protein